MQIQQASNSSDQPGTSVRSTKPDSRLLSVGHRPRGSTVGSSRSSIKKPPSQIIEEPRLNHILPEPNEISYTLKVAYNQRPFLEVSPQVDPFAWNLSATYATLIARVEDAQGLMQIRAEKGHLVRLYHGAFRIVGQDHEYSRKISALTELEEVTIQSICGFVYRHPKQRFHLEYSITYSSVRTQRNKGSEKYSDMVRQEVQRLMDSNENFSGQKFIPRIDRDELASGEIISGIIAQESNLNLDDIQSLSSRIIREGATGLFLACVNRFLGIDDFRHLLEVCHYNDDKLPQISENRTHLRDEEYRRLVENIHIFFAKTIDGGGRHLKLRKHEIMPVLHVTQDSTEVKTQLGHGAVGDVCKVRIEPGHHNLSGVCSFLQPQYVIVLTPSSISSLILRSRPYMRETRTHLKKSGQCFPAYANKDTPISYDTL